MMISFSRLFLVQKNICMSHGGGAISSILHGCGASIAVEQLNAHQNAENALVEAQTRIAQLDQVLQQNERPGAAVGQVVDTRVLERPDKWDEREKAWPNWIRDERLRGSHQCRKQYRRAEQQDDGQL